MLSVMRQLKSFEKDAGLQARPVLLTNPCEFDSLLSIHGISTICGALETR